jgi:hypothetical protein
MPIELAPSPVPHQRLEPVSAPAALERPLARWWFWLGLVSLGAAFVLLGAGNLDLGLAESRLGLAAREAFGPLGQVYGGWEPSVWPAQLAASKLWAWAEGGAPSSGAVRWPAAIAGVLIGIMLARRAAGRLGGRAGLFVALCWFGTVALLDRSAGGAIDLVGALALVAALDRLLGRGADTVAGLWAALAFLGGGWPPVALLGLATIVIGKPGSMLSLRLAWPPLLAAAGWSAWALVQARPEVWAAALALPLTQPPAWTLSLATVALGLPWSPLVLLMAAPSVRQTLPQPGRTLVIEWLQVSGACLLAGSLVPGLAWSALVPAVAGLGVAAGCVCEAIWAGSLRGTLGPRARRAFLSLAVVLVVLWVAIAVVQGTYLAAAVSYYRPISILLVSLAAGLGGLVLSAAWKAHPRTAILAIAGVALCLKIAYSGIYVPEWNYRKSQGPWGRAIGQWVPPNWPIYTVHNWPTDLAFATDRPVRRLDDPHLLAFKSPYRSQFVLLHPAEFDHWPSNAPPLVLVRRFQDERGDDRVLARTTPTVPPLDQRAPRTDRASASGDPQE